MTAPVSRLRTVSLHAVPPAWRSALLVWLLVVVAALLSHRAVAATMAGIWWNYETFTHALLVPPISLWLAWRKRALLAPLTPSPSWGAALALIAMSALVQLADLAAVNVVAHAALAAVIALSVPAVFGWRVARALAFPLLFLFFAVPAGDFLTPYLMRLTADFTVGALRLSGIPVQRQGMQFVIPSGTWSVVEACSGIRYLMASLMVGTLFAYLNYAGLRKRLAFIAVAGIVPIIANWLRAYMIVMIGHLSGNTLAVGVDHLIYGWVFFGLIVLAMFWIGMRWADPAADIDAHPAAVAAAGRVSLERDAGRVRAPWVLLATLVVLLALPELLLRSVLAPAATGPVAVRMPQPAAPWSVAPDPAPMWTPRLDRPDAQRREAWRDPRSGVVVGMHVGTWREQVADRKLVSSANLVTDSEDPRWLQIEHGGATLELDGATRAFPHVLIEPRGRYAGAGGERLDIWRFYVIDGAIVTSDVQAKLAVARQRLAGRGDEGSLVLLYTFGVGEQAAREAFQRFLAENSRTVRQALTPVGPRG